nr:succinate dehydrogenase subunit 6, mitochondrial-like [Ipomoea batatas]
MAEPFSFLDSYNRFLKRDKPLPSWTDADVNEFISSDPVHGPALKTAREVAQFGVVGSIVGGITTAGWAWKYSKSPHGTVLSLGFGAICGWTFGLEIGNHCLQLYRYNTVTAQAKFLEWWQNKS